MFLFGEYFLFNAHLRICFLILERGGGEGERENLQYERKRKHRLVAFHTCPDQGSKLQPLGVEGNAQTNLGRRQF